MVIGEVSRGTLSDAHVDVRVAKLLHSLSIQELGPLRSTITGLI